VKKNKTTRKCGFIFPICVITNTIPHLKGFFMRPTIQEVTTLKDLRAFIRFPNKLYKGSAYFVPSLFEDDYTTLRWDKNPAFEHCKAKYWLAIRDNKIVGRVAGIINQLHIDKWKQPYARFGWIDFIDDREVSDALLDTVEAWAKENNLTAVHGPLGFTDLDHEGMLVEGFNELGTLATIYNHPYYKEHLEARGYVKDTDWVEYEINAPTEVNETIAKVAQAALRRNNLHFYEMKSKKDILPYANQLFELINEAYKDLYGVVQLTQKQIDAYVKQYFSIIAPEFIPIVLDENDKMVAFGVTMPSFSKALQRCNGELFPFGFIYMLNAMKNNDRADAYLIAIKQEYQGRGVNAILMDRMIRVFMKIGVKKIESNPELETNHLVQTQWKYFETRQHKRRRVYIRHFSA